MTPEEKLAKEAADFQREKEAADKREKERLKKARYRDRQKKGAAARTIEVNDVEGIPALLAGGFLQEKDQDDSDAIDEAYAAFFRHYCHNPKPSKGRRVLWDDGDVSDWIRDNDPQVRVEREKWKEQDRLASGRREEKAQQYMRRDRDNRPPEVSELPKFKVERKRGGDAKGRNPGLPTNTIYNAQGMVLGRWQGKSTTPKDLARMKPVGEKKVARIGGKLHLPGESVKSNYVGDAVHESDLNEASVLGWAKRVKPKPTDN
jgi:hypothetical protein